MYFLSNLAIQGIDKSMIFIRIFGVDYSYLLLSEKHDLWGFGLDIREISCNLKQAGGDNVKFLATLPKPVKSLSVSKRIVSVVTTSNQVYAWGMNDFFELSPSETQVYHKAKRVQHFIEQKNPFQTIRRQATVEGSYTAVYTNAEPSTHRAAGSRAGESMDQSKQTPRNLPSIEEAKNKMDRVPDKVFSAYHSESERVSFFITNAGLYVTGNRESLLCPSNLRSPGYLDVSVAAQLHKFPKVIDWPVTKPKILGIGLSPKHAVAWDVDGNLYSWGKNEYGCLGINNNLLRNFDSVTEVEPVVVVKGTKIATAFAFDGITLAITYQGKVFYWGR